MLKKLARTGLLRHARCPEEWGGPGLDTVSYVLMLEEVARVYTAMSTALGVTNSAVQVPLLKFGTDAQKQKYLKRLATGEILGSFCLTEAAAGSDAAGIQATRRYDAAGDNLPPQRHQNLGHQRQRRRRLHRLRQNRSGSAGRKGNHRLSRRANFHRLQNRPPRRQNGPALVALGRNSS